MPEFPIRDSIITSLNAQEPWPDNVKLYQPYEVEQILLPDNASCLAVQAFLKMCNLHFEVEMRWNAEWMSPSGRVPFIKCGAFVVSELEPIVQFAANKGVSLCSRLATEDKAEMRAYMSLITNVLVNAELYISWLDNETFNAVTKVRNSSVYPWPLGWLQTRAKRNAVAKRLKALHWHDKTLDQVLADVEQCCNSLSQRLGDKDYFFGTYPTPLDALVYGHTRALLSTAGPRAPAAIKPITTTLLRHAYRVASLTDMKLNCQEEYLVNQAFQLSYRRPVVDRGDSNYRRSRLSLRLPSKDSMSYCRERDNNVFGFKPFASKQIIIMTSNEGTLTCRLDGRKQSSFNSDQISFVIDIIEDLLDRVDEIVFNEKLDAERNDFEVIAFANEFLDSKYGSVGVKSEDYLDPIECEDEENEQSNELSIDETLIGDGNMDDQVLEDDMIDALADNAQGKTLSSHPTSVKGVSSGTIDTSNKKAALGYTVSSSGDRGSLRTQNLISEVTDKSPDNKSLKSTNSLSSTKSSGFSSESKVTLKIPSDEEISVESLLRCLRKRNAYYASYLDADID